MPCDLQVPVPQEESSGCDYVQKLETRMQESHRDARKLLMRNRQHAKRQYDRTAQEPEFEENQWVWLFNPVRKKGKSPKLQVGWEEKPYRILRIVNEVLVRSKEGPRKRK